MTSLFDKFNKNTIGSGGRITDYTSKILSTGDFARVTDIEVILTSWNTILLTPKRSYQWDPEFGSDLHKMVFEPADLETASKIKDEVVSRLQMYDDRAQITDVNVSFLKNKKGFNIVLNVAYMGEQSELQLTVDESMFFNFMGVTTT